MPDRLPTQHVSRLPADTVHSHESASAAPAPLAGTFSDSPDPLTESPQDSEGGSLTAKEIARQRQITDLQDQLHRTTPIAGTIAETYLTRTCGIRRPLDGWPDVLRFDPIAQALVVVATTPSGEAQAADWIHLTIDESATVSALTRSTMIHRGCLENAVVRLPRGNFGPLLLATSIENGLSVWVSTLCETQIPLLGMASIQPPVGREVVACLDDHRRKTNLAKRQKQLFTKWRREGVRLYEAKPWPTRREDNSTFNDLLCAHGTGAVEQRINTVLELDSKQTVAVSVEEARRRLEKMMHAEGDAVLAGATGEAAIGVFPGTGKTREAHRQTIRVLKALRAGGDTRTVVIATPRHDLNDDQAERIRTLLREEAADFTVEVYRGAGASNPELPDTKMCQNLEDRRGATDRRLDPSKTVCPGCAFKHGCAFLAQSGRRADIWLVPHASLFHPKPAAIGKPAWLIIDENPISSALIGTGTSADAEDGPLYLSFDTLRRHDPIKEDPQATDRLMEARGMLLQALEASPNARLTRDALVNAGLTVDALEQAEDLEYRTKVEPVITEAIPRAALLDAFKTADRNLDLGRRAMLHREAAQLLRYEDRQESGRVSVASVSRDTGTVRAVRMKGVRNIQWGWKAYKTILDGTLNEVLLRRIWPKIRVNVLPPVASPNRHITQVEDRAFSLAMLDATDPGIRDAERRRRTKNLELLHLQIQALVWRLTPGKILIVAQKRVRNALEKLPPIRGDQIVWAHHGAVTGLDHCRDARAVIVIGRALPKPEAVESQAEALTGMPIQNGSRSWYTATDGGRELVGGSSLAVERECHLDPVAEAFRRRACEEEMVQIMERVRSVNRANDAERVDVFVLTDVVLPLPMETLLCEADIKPRVEDRMLAETGIVLASSEDSAAFYEWVKSPASLRQKRHGERSLHGRDWLPPDWLMSMKYRRKVNGAHHGALLFDPQRVPDPAARLREMLGELDCLSEPAHALRYWPLYISQ